MNRKHGTSTGESDFAPHDSSIVLFRKSTCRRNKNDDINIDDKQQENISQKSKNASEDIFNEKDFDEQLLSNDEESVWTWFSEKLKVHNTQGIFKLYFQKPFQEVEQQQQHREQQDVQNDSFLDKILNVFPQVIHQHINTLIFL